MDLSSESEPESPRERLLRQFEKDALSEGFSLYDFGTDSDNEDDNHSDASFGSKQRKFSDGIKSSSLLEDLHEGHFIQSRDVNSKIKAHMLQDMEAEALIREWGLKEKSSQHSPPKVTTVQDVTCVQKDSKGTLSKLKSIKFSSNSVGNQTGKEFVSLDYLAPMAMDQIEALSKVGLRIQSGMLEEDASSNIITHSVGEILTLQDEGLNISWSLARDGAAALQLLDLKDSSGGVDGVIGLSLTLDEWMRIDYGKFDDDKNE
ncbi:unnamed protein product [Lupinus luteus]|uniref:PMI1/PMIR1-2 C-terminal domain-containing protein n=1 Tax=Lupinus luteus TaxID=3873 RepID=A0AAV1Y3Z1_LUPLU